MARLVWEGWLNRLAYIKISWRKACNLLIATVQEDLFWYFCAGESISNGTIYLAMFVTEAMQKHG